MVPRLDGGSDGIEHLLGHLLSLQGNVIVINEGLESLPVFVLEHHFDLPPASLVVTSFFGINVESL